MEKYEKNLKSGKSVPFVDGFRAAKVFLTVYLAYSLLIGYNVKVRFYLWYIFEGGLK